jgi:hypothetical protein
MDDMYWSIERCGWVPCHGRHEAQATTWDAPEDDLPVLPQQRVVEPAPAEV